MADRDTSPAGAGSGQVPVRQPLRLLIVDDDPLSRSMMDLMLSPQGYCLGFASDGATALEAIRSGAYDLVFMDLILPDMNGQDVCREVRRWEAGGRHIPIVAVTGLDLPGQPLELVRAGMDDYVFKPYNVRTLTRLIRLYADGDEAAARATEAGAPDDLQDLPVLDIDGSLQDFGDDAESYRELLSDYVGSLPVRLERMLDAQREGDLERLGRECHSLKGISAGLGAVRLSRLAGRFNAALRAGDGASVPERLAQIEQSMQELQAEARAYLSSS